MSRTLLFGLFLLVEVLVYAPLLFGIPRLGPFGGAFVAVFWPPLNIISIVFYFIGHHKHTSGSASWWTYCWTFGIYFLINGALIFVMIADGKF